MRAVHFLICACSVLAACTAPRAHTAPEFAGARVRTPARADSLPELPAALPRATEAVVVALEELGFVVLSSETSTGRIAAETPPERRFFGLLGEQERGWSLEATVVPRGASACDLDLTLRPHHGPVGGERQVGDPGTDLELHTALVRAARRQLPRP